MKKSLEFDRMHENKTYFSFYKMNNFFNDFGFFKI